MPAPMINQAKVNVPIKLKPANKPIASKPLPNNNNQKQVVQNKEPKYSLRIINDKIEDREK